MLLTKIISGCWFLMMALKLPILCLCIMSWETVLLKLIVS